nr:unnamed protein product [Callosobruchus chinensis]
MILCQF